MRRNKIEDTIVALSTPPGRGALAIVRFSGPRSKDVVEALLLNGAGQPFASELIPGRSYRCQVREKIESATILDDGLLTFFQAPASYTGEDILEVSLHGNPVIVRHFILEVCERLRVRPADPGEFTRRAFHNGKIDLLAAEGVRRIIDSKSIFELHASRKLYDGELARMISRFRSALIHLKAETEAEVDFSTEDLTFESREQLLQRVQDLRTSIGDILERSRQGGRITSGIQVALSGIPNAGKSSLLNKILGWERSIVSEVEGTTRDFVSEEIELAGLPVRFVDTAGLRESEDLVEKEGVRRSKQQMERSSLIFHVCDLSKEPYPEPDFPAVPVWHILNKVDTASSQIRSHWNDWVRKGSNDRIYEISCKTEAGLAELRNALTEFLQSEAQSVDPFFLEERHRYHFLQMDEALLRLLNLWEEEAPAEICALEIDSALEHCGELTGKISTEEVLGRIFSVFCVGK
ncbi:MAG: tRNA uridine-5-carboxymethylaminomethyl(34) synthesis GTPase MnmE [Leptospiraceae bacterium]|nr:tRNA uridine-5-carboxymethylaminomethyl(34) synthesis GTPase MnmE [Leptospiraceae bacterium]